MKISENTQNLLPLGYLFLVVMGIVKESVFYYQIGINILNYSSIMDILLSPVATLTSHPVVLLVVIIIFIFHIYLPDYLFKNSDKKWVQKSFDLKKNTQDLLKTLPEEDVKKYFVEAAVKIFAMTFLSVFLGFGLGGGYFLSNKIKENKLKYTYKLNYNTGDSEQIYLINTNSLYYFYLAKGNKTVKIVPIASVKNIELTDNKMLK
jgi:hypothetical protein